MKTPTFLANMSAKTEKRVLWAIAAVLVMAVIFAFSSQASFASEEASDALAGLLSMEQQDLQTRVSNQSILFGLTLRKLAHIFLFAALGFCLYQALKDVKRRLVIAVGAAYLYGVLDEIHQSLAGRYGRWQDTLIDLIGIALGLAAALLLPKLNTLCKKWFYEDWDLKHPVAKKRLEWCLDALSLAAVMQYVGYRFLQTTMFEFIYSERYKTLTFLSLVVFGGVRFVYLFARKLWADPDEKAQIRRFLKFVGVCVLALPFFIVAYLHDYKVLIFIPICWMCLYDIQAELVFKWYVRVIGIMLGATVLCCLAGVVENIGRILPLGFVQSYGFINTTDFAAYFVFLEVFFGCIIKDHSWHKTLVLSFISIILGWSIYSLTASRTMLTCCIIFASIHVLTVLQQTLLRKKWCVFWKPRIVYILAICISPIMLMCLTIGVYLRGHGSEWTHTMDAILSGRLWDTWRIYDSNGIHLFGVSMTMHGFGASLVRDLRNYDFIDSSYAFLFLRYGIVLACIIMGLWMWMTAKSIRCKKDGIAMSMVIIAIYAFSESHFVDISYNILLAMPFCALMPSVPSEESTGLLEQTATSKQHKIRWMSCFTMISLMVLVYLILPRSISWMRTLFYLHQWNNGSRTISAFLFCVIILTLIYIAWKLLDRIWYQRSKHAIVLLVCTLVSLVAFLAIGNSNIKHGLEDYSTTLDVEKTSIQLVLDSAEKPVYTLEMAELYQRNYEGIEEGIMTAEDILQAQEGTVLADKDHELPVIILYGGQYLELTEHCGVYSFDTAVIDALSAAGYEWKSFYSSERSCNLEDLAELNRLNINAQGSLTLKNSRHSLEENRYIDQWAGDYEVRYRLSIDPVLLNTDNSESIGTLKVMGYKGEEMLLEREVFASDFDENGHCTITLSYSIPDTPRTEYLVIAADGVTLYVDEIAWRRMA